MKPFLFTQGPWHLAHDHLTICAPSGLPLGMMGSALGSISVRQSRGDALVAAAGPDMLAALLGLDCADILGVAEARASAMACGDEIGKRIGAAKAAMAKAMGERA